MAKLRIRIGQAEAEVEAEPERLKEAIELIPELASKLPLQRRESVVESKEPALGAPSEVPEHDTSSQFPVVALEKGDSLADVIGKFFSGPWGREKRKLSDVREALQSYGLNYPKQSVAVALLRLAKTSKLRRFKAEDGEYVYTSAVTFSSVPLVTGGQVIGELAPTQPNLV